MKVLVVGGGGREHALAWLLARSATVFCAPGNAGTADVGTNLPVSHDSLEDLVGAVKANGIDLTIVGPEAPLADGIADAFESSGLPIFGPSAAAARIEASKAFAKEVMAQAEVPTSASGTFTDRDQALDYVSAHAEPLVVKASGLAAGKGAIICETRAAAAEAVDEMFGGKFGDAGRTVVVEEFMEGEELSVFAMTDGEHWRLLPSSQDHKRLEEGDHGPNTGGMGAYAPVAIATPDLMQRIEDEVIGPTLEELANRGSPYKGILYAGLMVTPQGAPRVVEFNCRMGDPEGQAVLPLVHSNFLEHAWSIATGEDWPTQGFESASGVALTTVVASEGYPAAPKKGRPIRVPAETDDDQILFHSGTRTDGGRIYSSGGRVLCATGLGPDVQTAHRRSLDLVGQISFEGMVYRSDIGWREEARAGTA